MNRRSFLTAALAATRAMKLAAASPASIDLSATKRWLTLNGRSVELLTYNERIPGPQIELHPGQEVLLRLKNELRAPTNLHFHGLHLPPSPGVDDAFLRIPPGEQYEYRFTVPANHPGGTYWYHPHVHGLTADQVGGGLAGAIIVRSDIEASLGLSAIPEYVLVLQDFNLDTDGTLVQPGPMDLMLGREGSMVTADGRSIPQLDVAESGMVRVRFINACSSRFFHLELEAHPFVVIGVDGGLLPTPIEADRVLLTPGERIDAVIRGNRSPGIYRLWNLPYSRTGMMMRPGLQRPTHLASLAYQTSEPAQWQVPDKLTDFVSLPEPALTRRFILGQTMGGMGMGMGATPRGMAFTINGRSFDMDRVDTEVKLGAVEEWEFLNNTAMDHPMHIHTNAFQIVQPDNNTIGSGWKDTVLVKAGERVRVRMSFEDFTGTSVYHCHILDHEDMGMMGTLRIAG